MNDFLNLFSNYFCKKYKYSCHILFLESQLAFAFKDHSGIVFFCFLSPWLILAPLLNFMPSDIFYPSIYYYAWVGINYTLKSKDYYFWIKVNFTLPLENFYAEINTNYTLLQHIFTLIIKIITFEPTNNRKIITHKLTQTLH